MLNTDISPGIIITQNELNSPKLTMFMNVGIRPPPKNIVKVNKNIINPLKGNSCLDKAKPQNIVTETLNTVPTLVYIKVFLYPIHTSFVLKTARYPSNVKPTGQKNTLPCTTAVGFENDDARIFNKGRITDSVNSVIITVTTV